jgi:hypothetical protein
MCNSTDVGKTFLHDNDNDSKCWEVDLASLGLALIFGNMCDGGGAASQL